MRVSRRALRAFVEGSRVEAARQLGNMGFGIVSVGQDSFLGCVFYVFAAGPLDEGSGATCHS